MRQIWTVGQSCFPVAVFIAMPTIYPSLMRCTVRGCHYTWSVHPRDIGTQRCACGGELEVVDVAAETARLPFATKDEVEARSASGIVTLHPDAKK